MSVVYHTFVVQRDEAGLLVCSCEEGLAAEGLRGRGGGIGSSFDSHLGGSSLVTLGFKGVRSK